MLVELLIDGYNVIFQCGLMGKSTAAGSLEKARNRLLKEIASGLSEQQRASTVVIFDAQDRPFKDAPVELTYQRIRVQYAVNHEDADTLIEEIIRKHSVPKKLTVVSSDHRIQTAATRRRATSIDSDLWLEKIEAVAALKNETTTTLSESVELTDDEVAELLDQFSKPVSPALPSQDDSVDSANSIDSANSVDPEPRPAAEEAEKDADPLDGYDPFPPGYADDLF